MYEDVTWDYFDRLIESYAAASVYVSDLRELEGRINHAVNALISQPLGFGDFTAVLPTRENYRDAVTRKTAWAAQHVFGYRAWCVGSKILLSHPEPDTLSSPLIGQMEALGHLTGPVELAIDETTPAFSSAVRSRSGAESPANPDDGAAALATAPVVVPTGERIDALMCGPSHEDVIAVKGVSYTQAMKVSPDLWVNSDKQSLFPQPDRFMTRLYVPRPAVATLLAARELLRTAFPSSRIRAALVVINDPDCSWHYQAHDMSDADETVLDASEASGRVCMDEFPVESTFRQHERFGAGDGFAALPAGSHEDFVTGLPVDRPARALMLLSELWTRQINRPHRLAVVRASDLAAAVSQRCQIAYTKDLWRHDLEDCLERGHFIRRSFDRENAFAICPKGVARLLMLKQKFHRTAAHVPSIVMQHVATQAKRLATAPVV